VKTPQKIKMFLAKTYFCKQKEGIFVKILQRACWEISFGENQLLQIKGDKKVSAS
jgi:hypothetical protein